MANAKHHIPEGYTSVTPYLIIEGAEKAIQFYIESLDAIEIMRMPTPSGSIGHAELKVGNAHIMLADAVTEQGYHGPKSLGGTSVSLMLYVEDVDATVAKAVDAGAKLTRPVENQFYGDRMGTIEDPFGHQWHIATHIEDLTDEELAARAEEAMGGS